jgi:hypothetical protein
MTQKRYRAFISYSQKDRAAGRRIQRWLESYRIPKGVDAARNRRLGRFFRDDEEMSASPDVGASLRGAIEDSENLIVIASPHSAQSRWVNAEIRHFRLTGRGDRIFAVIVDGVPNSGNPGTECLPLALKAGDWDGLSMPVEPLALDLRTESKARIRARLAAGLLDVSFDDLWKREQRRRRLRALQWSAACLVIAGALGLMGFRTLESRRLAREQDRAIRLTGALGTVGTNMTQTFGAIRELVSSDSSDTAAADAARVILSWATPPAEIAARFPLPRLFTINNRLVLHTTGTRLDIGDATPKRRIGFSRGRMLVIYDNRIVSVDTRSGTVLDIMENGPERDLSFFWWRGVAFEAADGTAIVAGSHGGISNGQLWDAFLTVDPTGKLSLFPLISIPGSADRSLDVRFAEQAFVSSTCDALGILDGGQQEDGGAELPKLMLTIQNGLQPGSIAEVTPGGILTLLPKDLADEGTPSWRAGLESTVKDRGCRNPAFDSAGSHELTGLGGLLFPGDLAASPASPGAWHVLRSAGKSAGSEPQPWNKRPVAADPSNPCERGCRTIDEAGRQENFDGVALSFSWVQTTFPPGGLVAGPLADRFAANPVYTFHAQHNGGVESVWCRRVQGVPLTCVTSRTMLEFHDDWSAVDQRSGSGRFVFYSNGVGSYQLFDVETMRHVTPQGSQLPSRPGAAAFSIGGDDRLFVFVDNNRVSALEYDARGNRFVDISGSLSWQRRLADTDASNPVIGVMSPAPDDLIAAAESGLLVRFDWRTGRTIWSSQVPGIGRVVAIRRAPAGAFVALVGERGIRIVRTRDGLLASGALLPAYLFDAKFNLAACREETGPIVKLTEVMTDVTIDDAGAVTVSCGDAQYGWSAQSYTGDLVARLDALLGPSR